jgi:hypothetical protein
MKTTIGQRIPEGYPRLTLAEDLGQDIAGAWWLRTSQMARELASTVTTLEERLGSIVDIKVNWSTDGPPNLVFYGGECKRPPVLAICGRIARVNLLLIPAHTAAALALMVLRQAASLPIDSVHVGTHAYRVADKIVCAARNQRASLRELEELRAAEHLHDVS